MLLEGLEQIQLGVFLNVHAQLEQRRDGRVAGQEILRSGAEADDFQIFDSDDGSGNGNKFFDHFCHLFGTSHRILRDVSLQIPQLKIVAGV